MKNLVKTITIVALTLGTITLANAQKIAHISLDSLITTMPESKTAQEVAQKYLKDLENQVATMDTELQTKYADYMKNKETYSALVASTKETELQDLNKRIEDFKASAQQDYQRKYGELSKPIYDKAKKAIDLVAKENGYKYVLDTSSGNVLYTEPADDILPLVKKKLETMPAAQIPGSQPIKPAVKAGAGNTKPTK
ncbi:MAG: OmpH family outer membrane protein [Bacteroidia bacterium]|jgi:outer membrane protein|nr:OmpH family outer membrane protein [Bacteroidia bacterium]